MKLTDRTVASSDCPPGRKDRLLFDDALPGFGIRVTAGGARRFIFQYRTGEGARTVRRVTLGEFGSELSTAQARKKAEALRGQVRDARDPVAERRRAARDAAEEEAKAKLARSAAEYSLDDLIDDWTDQHLADRSASYANRAPADLRAGLEGRLSSPAANFSQADAIDVLDRVKGERGPIAANRLRAEARAAWNWTMRRGRVPSNPWGAVPRPAKENRRARVLSDAEMTTLWHAASDLGVPWTGIIRLLLLTGQRRSEVAGLKWTEIDLGAAMWALPGERTKNNREHTVPLSSTALQILGGVKRRSKAIYVFEGARNSVPSGFGKVKDRLDRALAAAAKDAGRAHSHWTIHDIRRTFATGLQRLGVRLEVTEAVLNHVSGSQSGIVGVYQRHSWDKEKREALEAWAGHLAALLAALEVPNPAD